MGIVDLLEEAAGAYAAVKAVEAANPEAGLLTKGIAAVAGFKGVEALKEHFAGDDAEQTAEGNTEEGDSQEA